MNRADYTKLLNEITNEISEPEGTFQSRYRKGGELNAENRICR